MAYEAKVIKDSMSPSEHRLTTMEVTFPRMVLPEFNTHRVFSRNSASSRAIPVEKQLSRVLEDPFIPIYWGANQPGMQASEELNHAEQEIAQSLWLSQRDVAVIGACSLIGGIDQLKDNALADRIDTLQELYDTESERIARPLVTPLHKQIANRLLEPFMWHTAIVTATEWDNFYALRAHPDAQPEIRAIADLMQVAQTDSIPENRKLDEYHLPFILEDELEIPLDKLIMVSVGRCARVSYLTHDGVRDPDKDIELYNRLASSGHMSPLEHVARPMTQKELDSGTWNGNFKGWHQHRKDLPNEDNFARVSVP